MAAMGLAAHAALAASACAELEGGVEPTSSSIPRGAAALTGAMLAVLSAGDEVLMVDCVYAPWRRFMRRGAEAARGDGPATSAPAPAPTRSWPWPVLATRLICLESPGSLSFEMQDVAAIAAAARARGILTLVDNTYGPRGCCSSRWSMASTSASRP